jgi:hypothetical protein
VDQPRPILVDPYRGDAVRVRKLRYLGEVAENRDAVGVGTIQSVG